MQDSNPIVSIETAQSGFYEGFNKVVAVSPKILILFLILWVALFPEQAAKTLLATQNWTIGSFGGWYIYITTFYLIVCLSLGVWPKSAKIKLGKPDEKPEFSTFTWFAMMFSAGLGVGMLTYSTAEPIFHFANNPDTIRGLSEGLNENNVRNAYKWTLLHYGLTPWACYGIIGIALGYFSYNKGQPLTIRAALYPLFGKVLNGMLGHVIDIVAILATIIGVGVTIGYGISQFASGVFNITGAAWLVNDAGQPTLVAQLCALVIIISASTWSALTGINKGIKWLSNINMSLSYFLVAFFVIFGATAFGFKSFFLALWDYFVALPSMSFTVWTSDGVDAVKGLAEWQGTWTVFYWAWWVAFAPFVGLFLARVSRGRTIREYVIGAMLMPMIVGLTWFAFIGGTAINMELSGIANGAIVNADISAQLFQTVNLLLSPTLAKLMSIVIVILLSTYLVTSADSAILIINTLASAGGNAQKPTKHIIIWGVIFSMLITTLLAAGGMDALRSTMIISALPFSLVMALMGVSLLKSILFDKP